MVGGLLMKQPTHSFICLLLSLAYCFYLPVTRRGRSRVRGQYIWPRPLSLVGEFGFVAFAVIVGVIDTEFTAAGCVVGGGFPGLLGGGVAASIKQQVEDNGGYGTNADAGGEEGLQRGRHGGEQVGADGRE